MARRSKLESAVGVAYVVKGAAKDSFAALGLSRSEPSGVVIGKRSGVSQNLGKAARIGRGLAA